MNKFSPAKWLLFSIVMFFFSISKSFFWYGDFDAASWESQGTSFTTAGMCSGSRWFAHECAVMHRSQHTQPPRSYDSLHNSIANLLILHTLTQYHTH